MSGLYPSHVELIGGPRDGLSCPVFIDQPEQGLTWVRNLVPGSHWIVVHRHWYEFDPYLKTARAQYRGIDWFK
jgi:hypothetical protein